MVLVAWWWCKRVQPKANETMNSLVESFSFCRIAHHYFSGADKSVGSVAEGDKYNCFQCRGSEPVCPGGICFHVNLHQRWRKQILIDQWNKFGRRHSSASVHSKHNDDVTHTEHILHHYFAVITQLPKFHLARHVISRHDSTRSTCRASRDERVEPCCSNMADDDRLYKFSRFYALACTRILFVPSNKIN